MSSPAAPLIEYLLQPLSQWLRDPATEDIAINQPGKAFIRHHGAWEGVDIPLSLDDLEELAILAGSLRKQEVGVLSPLCATELPAGERLQICLPPAVEAGRISLTIRVHEQDVAPISDIPKRYKVNNWNKPKSHRGGRNTAEALAAYDSGDFQVFLEAAVKARLNVLMCGATGAGKTTLSKTVISAIPHTKRLITIEDTIELKILQPNVVRLLYSKDDLSGTNITSEALVQAGMRMIPEIFLLQELRDDAAWSYLTAICSGHPGSITTIHGRSPADALRRLSLLVKSSEAGRSLEREDLISLFNSAIDIIIPLEKDDTVVPDIHDVWFAAAAHRRGESAGTLLAGA
jgi:type IV secretion system protein VirB11